MSEYVGRGLTHKQGILESGKLRGRNFGEKLWGSRACMGLAWWEEDGCELWHKAVCGTTTPGSRLLVCRVTLCTTMQVYAKFGLLGAVSFTLCNMYCSFLHNDVCDYALCMCAVHICTCTVPWWCPVTCVVGEETDRGQRPPSLSNISNVTKLVQTNTLKLNTLLTRYNIAQAQNVVW